MNSVIELTKFCDEKEILLSDELWSYLAEEKGTMKEILDLIKDIASPTFDEDYTFLCKPHSITIDKERYEDIITKWHLIDELSILNSWRMIEESNDRKIVKYRNSSLFLDDGKYNYKRNNNLLSYINK